MENNFSAVLPFLAPAIGCAACLPLTYKLTREGNVFLSMIAVAAIAILSKLLSGIWSSNKESCKKYWRELIAFATGALISETAFFAYYDMTYGSDDPKLSVGVALVVIEFFVIASVGNLSIWITKIAIRWLAKPKV